MPLTRIQRLIGERMLASKRSKPCFYLETKADVTELMGMRHNLSKALGVKITSNAFFIRAMALAAMPASADGRAGSSRATPAETATAPSFRSPRT